MSMVDELIDGFRRRLEYIGLAPIGRVDGPATGAPAGLPDIWRNNDDDYYTLELLAAVDGIAALCGCFRGNGTWFCDNDNDYYAIEERVNLASYYIDNDVAEAFYK